MVYRRSSVAVWDTSEVRASPVAGKPLMVHGSGFNVYDAGFISLWFWA